MLSYLGVKACMPFFPTCAEACCTWRKVTSFKIGQYLQLFHPCT